ncbi:MAG TPA: hypothetical protein VMH31_04615 [Methylomirabilota bacterium]|nr:hypothetical protein [Methylomirabilota bacterium]
MDETTRLHTAGRRYCEARFSEWVQVYQDLQRKENWRVENLFKPGWDYSEEAYRTFPRYRVAKNTQIEIERLRVDPGMSLTEVRKFLIAASVKAEAQFQNELKNKVAQVVIHEEAEDFRIYIEALTLRDLMQVEPLPYRRVLSKDESEQLWDGLRRAWSIGDNYWFPLKKGAMPQNILAFHTDYFESIDGQHILRDALERRGVSAVFLLHEFGDPEYEVALGIFEPGYRDGGEQYSTSVHADWIVYASHESSITVGGGWLIDAFRRLHPECIGLTYKGPYSTPDRRGTWKT